MSNENIIREIDEELRSDRMRKLWRSFGPYVIGAAVAIVLIVAVNEGWSWWQNSNSSRSSDQFYAALQLADGTDADAAKKALDEVIAANHGGYPALARFREAALLANQGKTAEAVAAYDALSTGESNSHMRELALVLAANLLVDGGDVAQVEQRVGGLVGNSPMRNAAREAIGLVKYKAGDLEGARASFEEAVSDPQASQELRQRLTIYLAQLVAEGVAAPVADAAAAETPVVVDPATAAPAETSVGDAPALDTTPAPEAAPAMEATPAMEAAPAMEPAPATDAPAAPAN